MNYNIIRPAAIGVTAGVIAGAITVAGIIAYDNCDPWDKVEGALERRRLTPAERNEFDRLQAQKDAQAAEKICTAVADKAATRAKFRPDFLRTATAATTLEELPVPVLIDAIDRAAGVCKGTNMRGDHVWIGHLTALRDEFRRRRGWGMSANQSRLDQLRLENAEKRVYATEFDVWQWPTTSAPGTSDADPADPIVHSSTNAATRTYPPYPAFEGPFTATDEEL